MNERRNTVPACVLYHAQVGYQLFKSWTDPKVEPVCLTLLGHFPPSRTSHGGVYKSIVPNNRRSIGLGYGGHGCFEPPSEDWHQLQDLCPVAYTNSLRFGPH